MYRIIMRHVFREDDLWIHDLREWTNKLNVRLMNEKVSCSKNNPFFTDCLILISLNP